MNERVEIQCPGCFRMIGLRGTSLVNKGIEQCPHCWCKFVVALTVIGEGQRYNPQIPVGVENTRKEESCLS